MFAGCVLSLSFTCPNPTLQMHSDVHIMTLEESLDAPFTVVLPAKAVKDATAQQAAVDFIYHCQVFAPLSAGRPIAAPQQTCGTNNLAASQAISRRTGSELQTTTA